MLRGAPASPSELHPAARAPSSQPTVTPVPSAPGIAARLGNFVLRAAPVAVAHTPAVAETLFATEFAPLSEMLDPAETTVVADRKTNSSLASIARSPYKVDKSSSNSIRPLGSRRLIGSAPAYTKDCNILGRWRVLANGSIDTKRPVPDLY